MGKINVLSFAVANLIAAGEVVDRPASVIKELMENAIDAGAKHITVEIRNGGITFMRVADDGCGISPEDLPVAVRRHATSKIKDASDLDGILTLGFRGEALAAIAAVSDLRILTRTPDAEYGSLLTSRAGETVDVTEQGAPVGTTVIVENLFGRDFQTVIIILDIQEYVIKSIVQRIVPQEIVKFPFVAIYKCAW